MTLEYVIETYGYPAVLIGTFLEGEAILVLAGFAARLGHLKLDWVILAAILGSFSGDQLYFHLGRWHGPWLLARFPTWQERTEKVHRWLERYSTVIIFACRFMYGFRIVAPVAIGMSRVRSAWFAVMNGASAVIWATVIAGAGYLFGGAMKIFLGHVRRYEVYGLGVLALLAFCVWLFHLYRRSARKAKARKATEGVQ